MTAYQHAHPDGWAPTDRELRNHLAYAHCHYTFRYGFDEMEATHQRLTRLPSPTPPTVVVPRAALQHILRAAKRNMVFDDEDLDAWEQLNEAVAG